jgi:hypothetical protein
VVAVGDSAEVELVFTATANVASNVSKSATVTCNDNDRGSFQLSLRGKTILSPDSTTPLTLSALNMTWEQDTKTKEGKLVVKNVSKNPVKIHAVSQPLAYLKVTIPDSEIKPGKEKEIKVKILPDVKELEFKKSFTFEVNDSAHTRYTIPTLLNKVVAPESLQAAPVRKLPPTAADTTGKGKK